MRDLFDDWGSQVARGRALWPIVQASCVGGTTVINSAIVVRTPADCFDRWSREYGIDGEGLSRRVWEHQDRIESELSVGVVPPDARGLSNILAMEAADGLGWQSHYMARSVNDCEIALGSGTTALPDWHVLADDGTVADDAVRQFLAAWCDAWLGWVALLVVPLLWFVLVRAYSQVLLPPAVLVIEPDAVRVLTAKGGEVVGLQRPSLVVRCARSSRHGKWWTNYYAALVLSDGRTSVVIHANTPAAEDRSFGDEAPDLTTYETSRAALSEILAALRASTPGGGAMPTASSSN